MQKLGKELVTCCKNSLENDRSCSYLESELFLPPEIIFEIMSWLPVKSLLVFKAVCKLWFSIIDDHEFINVHMRRSKTVYVWKDKQNENGDSKEFKCLCLNNGLLVEKHKGTNKYSIQNPATKFKLDLPDPHHKLKSTLLIYLPSADSYKLINVYGKRGTKLGGCEVLSVGTDSAWRILDIPSFYELNRSRMKHLHCRCIDTTFYYVRFSAQEIVCLDMDSESFETVKLPGALFQSWDNVVPIRWDKKLSLAKVVGQELHVWVLEDYRKQTRAVRKIIISLSFLNNYPNITEIPVPRTFSKGRLQFHSQEDHRVAYYVESEKVQIKYAPRGQKFQYIMHHTLVNPLRIRPNETTRMQ